VFHHVQPAYADDREASTSASHATSVVSPAIRTELEDGVMYVTFTFHIGILSGFTSTPLTRGLQAIIAFEAACVASEQLSARRERISVRTFQMEELGGFHSYNFDYIGDFGRG
jgi:hypothetical protein